MGGRAADAAFYPMPFVTETIRGIRDTADAEAEKQQELSPYGATCVSRAAMFHDQPQDMLAALRAEDHGASNSKRTTVFRMADGTLREIPLHQNFKTHYRDEYTSEQIPQAWAEAAIQE